MAVSHKIRVSWKGTNNVTYEKICDNKIVLKDFVESLEGKALSSFKQRFKYGFQIKVETIQLKIETM